MHVRQTLRQVDVVEPSYFLYFYLTKIKVQLAILAEFLLVFVPGGGGVCRPVLQTLTRFQTKKCNFLHPLSDLAWVVQTLDSAIRWINLYPVDGAIGFSNTYPPDSDLSGG